jgi:hypothetical protein
VDEAAILSEAAAFFAGKKHAMDLADQQVAKFLPHYRDMYQRAGSYPLKMERRLPSLA